MVNTFTNIDLATVFMLARGKLELSGSFLAVAVEVARAFHCLNPALLYAHDLFH